MDPRKQQWLDSIANDRYGSTLRCPLCYKTWGGHYGDNCFTGRIPDPNEPVTEESVTVLVVTAALTGEVHMSKMAIDDQLEAIYEHNRQQKKKKETADENSHDVAV